MERKQKGLKKTYLDNEVYVSEFIDLEKNYSFEELTEKSRPSLVRVLTPEEDHTSLPARHRYENFIDFNISASKVTVEEPLDPNDSRRFIKYLQELVEKFSAEGLDSYFYPEALKQPVSKCSRYKKEITVEEIVAAISTSAFKDDFIKYIGECDFNKTLNKSSFKRQKTEGEKKGKNIVDFCEDLGLLKVKLNKRQKERTLQKLKRFQSRIEKKVKGDNYFSLRRYKKMMTPEQIQFVLEFSEDPSNAFLPIKERTEIINKHLGVECNQEWIRGILKDNAFLKKKMSYSNHLSDCVAHKNARCQVAKELILMYRTGKEMISIDETWMKPGAKYMYGWAKKGAKTHILKKNQHPVYVVAAICRQKVIGYIIRKEMITGYSFKYFLEKLIERLKNMDSDYKNKYFIFMDNHGSHKVKFVKDFVELKEVKIVCNAPNSPQLNPIENVFSMFKSHFKKMPNQKEGDFYWNVYKAFKTVRPNHLHSTFLHAMKSLIVALRYENLMDNSEKQVGDYFGNPRLKHIINLLNISKMPK